MSNRIVTAAVDRHFRPPNAARAARRQVFVVAGTALIFTAALTLDGWLSWLLWGWASYRALVFVVLLAVGPQLADELTRRLNALPPSIRRVLDGTTAEPKEGAA